MRREDGLICEMAVEIGLVKHSLKKTPNTHFILVFFECLIKLSEMTLDNEIIKIILFLFDIYVHNNKFQCNFIYIIIYTNMYFPVIRTNILCLK